MYRQVNGYQWEWNDRKIDICVILTTSVSILMQGTYCLFVQFLHTINCIKYYKYDKYFTLFTLIYSHKPKHFGTWSTMHSICDQIFVRGKYQNKWGKKKPTHTIRKYKIYSIIEHIHFNFKDNISYQNFKVFVNK